MGLLAALPFYLLVVVAVTLGVVLVLRRERRETKLNYVRCVDRPGGLSGLVVPGSVESETLGRSRVVRAAQPVPLEQD